MVTWVEPLAVLSMNQRSQRPWNDYLRALQRHCIDQLWHKTKEVNEV